MFSFSASEVPSAKVADGRLVLSLPDAETPALWMMDLADAQTSVIRLESDSKGFYVLKKHGQKATPETIAVYRDRTRGARAMNIAARAMEKARAHAGGRPASKIGRIFHWFLVVWFVLYVFNLDLLVVRAIFAPFMGQGTPAVMAQQQPQQQQPAPAQQPAAPINPNAAGVPLSAEDFLRSQQGFIN